MPTTTPYYFHDTRNDLIVAKEKAASIKPPFDLKLKHELFWSGGRLTRRDLGIPIGEGKTNPTGSMLFKKGNLENIDQRTYFREVLFYDLKWTSDPHPAKSHLERSFLHGTDHGRFCFTLTHSTRKDSASYLQNNCMTSISWG